MASDAAVEALARIYHDPVAFVEHWLSATPEPWQRQFLLLVAKHDRVAVRSGHGVGKTTALAWLVLWWLLTRKPSKIGITAPAAAQIDAALWPELRSWHRRLPKAFADLLLITNDRVSRVDDPEEGFAIARTASRERPEALQGLHSANLMFVVDEGSGVDELIFEVAASSLSTPGAKIIMTGNPTRSSGYFYRAFHEHSHMWKTLKVSAFDSKYSREGTLIEEYAGRENSNAYRVRILGEFPEHDDDVLISRSLVESAINRDVDCSPTTPTIWGLDVARFGDDRSALCIRQGNIVRTIKTWQQKNLMQLAGIVKDMFDSLPKYDRPESIVIDTIGLGAGVYDRLKEQGLPVVGCNVAETPAIKERYWRLRDELWAKVRDWFETRSVKIPDDPELVAELCAPTFDIDSSGKIKVESKASLKKRGHRSPDRADSIVISLLVDADAIERRKRLNKPIKMDMDWVL